MKFYHIGFVKDGKTLVIQARETKDELSCETWKYWGLREIAKKELNEKKRELLACTNALYHKSFERVRVE
ncbi:MAG: hypothetical protein MUP27_09180 [Desulfobacterales bacterium]|nr:hypothetical protein [Desulfobacterales bacterium]